VRHSWAKQCDHYHAHESLSLIPVLGMMNPVYSFPFYLFMSHVCLGFLSSLLSLGESGTKSWAGHMLFWNVIYVKQKIFTSMVKLAILFFALWQLQNFSVKHTVRLVDFVLCLVSLSCNSVTLNIIPKTSEHTAKRWLMV
jgi:hypothetical protein